jgi:hypothetical protein
MDEFLATCKLKPTSTNNKFDSNLKQKSMQYYRWQKSEVVP